MIKIFIAGSSGYIGQELTTFLKKKEGFELHACYYRNRILKNTEKGLYTHKIDLTKKKAIKKLQKINPDLIINLAAFTNPARNELNPKKSFNENVIINGHLIDYCVANNKKIIFTSTDKVYSGVTKSPSENNDLNPNNIYGINKLKCEKEIKQKLKKYLIFRYASAYSEIKNTNKNFINKQVNNIRKKKKVYLATNIYRLFISTEYLCAIIFECIKNKWTGTYNIGSVASNYHNLVNSICKKKNISTKGLLFRTTVLANPQFLIPSTKKINNLIKKNI